MTSPLFARLLRWLMTPCRWAGGRAVRAVLRRWPTLSNQTDYLLALVRSIPEQSLVPSVSRHIVGMTVIRHAGSETYSYPSELPPAFRTEMHFARRHIYRVRDVCVNARTGACCTEQHGFQESFGSVRRWLLNQPVAFRRAVPLPIDGPVTCVNTTGYAHYLLEEVPRLLWTMQHYEGVHVLTPAQVPRFVADVLSDLKHHGRLKGEVIPREEMVLSVHDFIFTQAEAYSGFWHANDLSLLRACFLPSDRQREDNHLQVYVSRLHSLRSYANEAEVETYLRSMGVEVVRLEDLGFVEQVRLFSRANVVISPHGGGMANLVWCSPGTKVIEFFTGEVFNDCFARLCSQLGCKYQPLWATDSHAAGVVDLDKLERALVEQDRCAVRGSRIPEPGDARRDRVSGQEHGQGLTAL